MPGGERVPVGRVASGSGPVEASEALQRAARAAADRLDDQARRDFAVVVPALDEAPVIRQTIRALMRTFQRYGLAGEVVLVDDGSSDGTAELAREEAGGWPHLTVVRHRANLGKTEALLTGVAATERRWIVLFDADLQHLPDEIPRFLAKAAEGWDMVTGRKVGAYDKRAVSSVYNALGRRLFDVPVSDMNSMKAFRREILDGLTLRHDWHRYLVVLANARGWRIGEIEIELHPRRAGVSKYTGSSRIVVGVLDLLAVGFLIRFSGKPLLLFGSVGVGLLGSGVAVGMVAFWLRFGLGMGFRPLLYLVILLVTVGVLLIVTGFLGELVAQLRDEVAATRRALRVRDDLTTTTTEGAEPDAGADPQTTRAGAGAEGSGR